MLKDTKHMKLSIQSRIFIIVGFFTVLLLLALWIILRPRYETSVINERMNTIQNLQTYAVEGLDHIIASWSDVTHFIAWEVTERPKDGEAILRSMVTLHPEIIQIKIQSSHLSDELASQNTLYRAPTLQFHDSVWIRSNIDSVLQVAWLNDTSAYQQLFITRVRFHVQNIPFVLTVVWDAKQLQSIFAELPLSEGYSASIQSASSIVLKNTSPFHSKEMLGTEDQTISRQRVRQNESHWCILTRAFQTVQLWMIIAVPEKPILKPVEDLLLYATLCIIGLSMLMFFFGWLIAFQIRRPVARLVNDVQRLSNLEVTETIQIPAIKDLRAMGEAIELMRQALELRQRLRSESPPEERTGGQDGNS
jgi:HAMP domain-containing protein